MVKKEKKKIVLMGKERGCGFLGGQNGQKGIMLMGNKKEAELTAKPDYGLLGMKMVKNAQKEIIGMEKLLVRLTFKFSDR